MAKCLLWRKHSQPAPHHVNAYLRILCSHRYSINYSGSGQIKELILTMTGLSNCPTDAGNLDSSIAGAPLVLAPCTMATADTTCVSTLHARSLPSQRHFSSQEHRDLVVWRVILDSLIGQHDHGLPLSRFWMRRSFFYGCRHPVRLLEWIDLTWLRYCFHVAECSLAERPGRRIPACDIDIRSPDL